MCGLCGVFGVEEHWADAAGKAPAFAQTRMGERAQRIVLANRVLLHYGLRLADWGGHSYIVRNLTGQSHIVENLSQIWGAAERLAGRRCDPLDPALLATLQRTEPS
jgi:hypothetical protein